MRRNKPSRFQMIRALLLLNGWELQEFADVHGFNILSVRTAIDRHWGRNTNPRGDIMIAILNALDRCAANRIPARGELQEAA